MDEQFRSASIVYALLALVFTILLSRLFYLQVIEQNFLQVVSSQNSIRKVPIDAPRGVMYDRNGIAVVDNQPLYTLQITPSEFDAKTLPLLSQLTGVSIAELEAKIAEGKAYNRFAPTKAIRDLTPLQLARLEENLWRLPGVSFALESKRKYLPNVRGSHIFGYAKAISKAMYEKAPKEIYSRDDIIGYRGLEKQYEDILRGIKGTRYLLVNSLGKHVGDWEGGAKNIPFQTGNDLLLTIDAELQGVAESLLVSTGKSGALVAMDPRNGEIIACSSQPDYDLNVLGGFTEASAWQAIANDPRNPLFDRVIQTRYPPGSTYKIISAIAALEDSVATPSTTFYCTGHFRFGNKDFLCHRGNGHGSVDMTRAIQVSCNVYFYNLARRIGFERWTKYGRMFGFGQKTGVDIPDEQTATLPSPEYFDKIYGKRGWTEGYLISLGIGQGEMGASPMQMVVYAAALGNYGTVLQPHFVRAYRDKSSGAEIELAYESKKLPISKATFDVARNGMLLAVESGTGGRARVPGVKVAGKTGTAQNPHGEDHAWFICFAPYDNPTIALAVLVENAGFGGSVAAPIAGEWLKRYFKKYPPPETPSVPATTSDALAQNEQ
ncbi:MAG: penicillin-binding protein 2 [Chloroherpetonaceae bacterium]|nr:penicillin-binding protein 2 [Chloroherpetonaceae bacterium]